MENDIFRWIGKGFAEMKAEALGIAIGDMVWTNYDPKRKYRVRSIWGPFQWFVVWELPYSSFIIWPYQVISMTVDLWDKPDDRDVAGYLNYFHQDGERYISDMGDELFVERRVTRKPVQLDIFSAQTNSDPRTQPYSFDPTIDYSTINKVFKCCKCRRDFNGHANPANPNCPYCGNWFTWRLCVMPRISR